MDSQIREYFEQRTMPVPWSGCHEWLGTLLHGRAYCRIGLNCKTAPVIAARVAYALEHGSVPDGKWILHRCNNPRCVSPAHLYAGTPRDNKRDAVACGAVRLKEFCVHGHPMSGANLLFKKNGDRKGCRACSNIRLKKRYWDEKRARSGAAISP